MSDVQIMLCPSLMPRGKAARRKAMMTTMMVAEAFVTAMQTGELAFPKPKDKENRVLLSPAQYRALRRKKYLDQNKKCGDCGNEIRSQYLMHLHHKRKRSLANNSANVEANTNAGDSESNTIGLCGDCHERLEHGK